MDEASGKIDRCGSAQLKALLSLADDRQGERPLAAEIGGEGELRRRLEEILRREAGGGDATLDAIASKETPLETLRGLKGSAKGLISRARSADDRNAGTLLYHAIIAAAFAHHGVNISSRDLDGRMAMYEDLSALLAVDPLGAVFRAAVDRHYRQVADRGIGRSGA